MKYLRKFFESERSIDFINSSINDVLIDLFDDGFDIDSNLKSDKLVNGKDNLGKIRIFDWHNYLIYIDPPYPENSLPDFRKKHSLFSDYKDNFEALYNLLEEYGFVIFTISVNSIPLGVSFNGKDFDFIWNKIIDFSDDFLSISIDVYKK
jgi:hypothetical protein